MKGIGLPVLCCLLALFLIILGHSYSEGFADKKAPDFCGTYGYTDLKDIANPKNIGTQRKYTQSGCDKLEGVLRGTECLQLKKKGKSKGKDKEEDAEAEANINPDDIKRNYSKACVALNSQDTPQPSECGGLGKHNQAYTMTIEGKTIKVPAKVFMIYTESECDSLEGNFTSIEALSKITKIPLKDLKKASGGDADMGMCQGLMNFSNGCTGPPSLIGSGTTSLWNKITQFFE